MSKNVLVIGGATVLVLMVLGISALLLFSKKPTGEPSVNFFGEPTTGPTLQGTESEKMVITQDGSYTPVRDFTKESTSVVGSDGGTYYDLVHGEGPIFGNEGYTFEIQYDDTRFEFLIVLVSEPLSQSRTDAENFLLEKLNVDKETLCTLNVFVAVPLDVNEFYGQYRNLGLSFCPDSVQLP